MAVKTVYVCDACAKEAVGDDERPVGWYLGRIDVVFEKKVGPRAISSEEMGPPAPHFGELDLIVCSSTCARALVKKFFAEMP